MPTKTDRILSYLPGTFRALLPVTGQPSALYAFADTFGSELQQAENKLAEIMLAHWVDTADRNAEEIEDLAKIAALYGLAPRDDEDVEEFRQHLLRYVRTFLEGTVTVQGILRVAAEALGLTIADDYQDLDTWWTRGNDELISVGPDAADAATLVLGFPAALVQGHPARPARLEGIVDLSFDANLRSASILRVQVDDLDTQEIQLVGPGEDPHQVTLVAIVAKVNAALHPHLGTDVAFAEHSHLVIQSPTTGPASRLEFEEGDGDAAMLVLGLRPLAYFGAPARPASITGTVELSGDLDLRTTRFLRLLVDGSRAAEVDCGGATPGHRAVEEVRDAINAALGIPLARMVEADGRKFLALQSPTPGNASSIAFLASASQDAALRLFGPHAPTYLGQDDTPAEVSSPELGREVDLSLRYNVRISLDDSLAFTINCAGLRPASTTLDEVANAINAGLGVEIARRVGPRLRLASGTAGEGSQIRFETPDEADATELLFGLPPRTRRGTPPTSARIVGKAEIGEVNLMARHQLRVRVDGGPPVLADLRLGVTRHGFNPSKAILPDLVEAVKAALGADTANDDGLHLVLASPSLGGGSSLELLPLEVEQRRRFVSRAVITGEASGALLGFNVRTARGVGAVNARLVGKPDLSHGVDLRAARYVRLGLDGKAAVDIDCAGPRPRATLLDEVVQNINRELHKRQVVGDNIEVAFSDGRHLVLASPITGAASQISFEAPRAQDALDLLLGLPPSTVYGSNASGVTYVGLPDLSGGVDLPAHAAVKIGIDGGPAVDVPLTGNAPTHLALNDLVVAISLKLGSGLARQDGKHLVLASPQSGAAARLSLEIPTGADATPLLLGFTPPRAYQGDAARPAEVTGAVDLSAEHDLSVARFLRIGVDARPPVDIDCAKTAPPGPPTPPGEVPPPDPATKTKLDDIVKKINAALKADVASADGGCLKLTSTTTGLNSRIVLERHTGGDARALLLGPGPAVTTGAEPQPASLVGEVSLLQPVDLSQRGLLRIAVDGQRPREVDVRGSSPSTTFLDEAVAKIENVFPGLAVITDDDRLRLTSPTAGSDSSVAILPIRTIDLLEFPPESAQMPPRTVRHGTAFAVMNNGAGEAEAVLTIWAPDGASGAALVNQATAWRIRLLANLRPGESARIWGDPHLGLLASLTSASGQTRRLPTGQVIAGPLGGQATVPFEDEWLLTGSSAGPARLLLDNPLAAALVEIHSLRSGPDQPSIALSVIEAEPGAMPDHPGDGSLARLVGRLRQDSSGFRLEGTGGKLLARLRNGLDGGLEPYLETVVAAAGPFFSPAVEGDPFLLIVQSAGRLFNVTIHARPSSGNPATEAYRAVTIGGSGDPYSLVAQINTGPQASQWVRARMFAKASVLRLPRGRSLWRYLDCDPDRYNQGAFEQAHFAGGTCAERGIFNVSRFDYSPPETTQAVFATAVPSTSPPVVIGVTWEEHRPGAFQVILPADLPEKFGGRFNQDRFGRRSAEPEIYPNAVVEPVSDDHHIVKQIRARSVLVQANIVGRVPLGWAAVPIPFRKPSFLTLGSEETPARIYLSAEGLDGFIELRARTEGDWGNGISISARKVGPALFDVTLAYDGAVFEQARQIVSGPALPELVVDVLKPAPVGVLLAKAAGIRTVVTREGTDI